MTTYIRATRKTKGLSLRDLASRSSVNSGHLSRIERGRCSPNVTTLRRIARALDLHNVDHILKPFDPEAGGEDKA